MSGTFVRAHINTWPVFDVIRCCALLWLGHGYRIQTIRLSRLRVDMSHYATFFELIGHSIGAGRGGSLGLTATAPAPPRDAGANAANADGLRMTRTLEAALMMLDGKAAIVTGAARGVAKGVAIAFAKAGARVFIVDREEALGRETESEFRVLGAEAHFLAFDLTRRDELGQIVEAAAARFGRLDVLVNAAQASRQLPLVQTSNADMEVAFDTGFWPTFVLMRAAYPHLVKARGSVINFASGAAFDAIPTQGSYSAAKEAIRAISKVAAGEWGPEGVRVNVICPFANSPGVQAWGQHAPADYEAQLAKVSLRRIGDCERDIGAAAVFLASDAAGYVTGQTLMVDGGQTKAF